MYLKKRRKHVMGNNQKGIVRNAFYKRNERGDTKGTLWGRTQGANMEMFEYKENEEGKIVIVERKAEY